MLKRIMYGWLTMTTIIGLILTVAPLAHAAPEEGGMRWWGRTVCVDLHPSNDGHYWYTTTSVPRMDAMPNIRYVYESNCEAAGRRQIIHVYETKILKDDGTCDYGKLEGTTVYDTPDGYTYDGYISRVTIRLNDCYAGKLTKTHRISIVNHSLMHGVGPGHWNVCPSVVGPDCGTSAGAYPSSYDKNRVYKWYAEKLT